MRTYTYTNILKKKERKCKLKRLTRNWGKVNRYREEFNLREKDQKSK